MNLNPAQSISVNQNRKSLWRTGAVQLAGLLVFVAAAEALANVVQPMLAGAAALPIGLVLAVVPAVLWLAFFYAQDRAEPEPRRLVIGVALLGGLLAAAIGEPLLTGFFRINTWITRSPITEIIGSILLIGMVQEGLKYAAVRFSLYHSDQFNQRMDGVLYGVAAGLGYATMTNISGIIASAGFVDLGAGVIRIVITALVHGALGGLVGYFVARAKFDDEPVWWMALGLTLAAVCNGLFAWLRGAVSQSRVVIAADGTGIGGHNPWLSLIAATVFAGVLLAVVFWLMRRANMSVTASAKINERDTASTLAALALVAVALLGGLLYRNAVEGQRRTASTHAGISVSYPAWWQLNAKNASKDELIIRDTAADFPTTFEVHRFVVDGGLTDSEAIGIAANALAVSRGSQHNGFKVFDLNTGEVINTLPAASSSYVYISDSGNVLQEHLPMVVLGEDRLLRKGNSVYAFSLQSTEFNRVLALNQFDQFVSSAQLP